VRVLVVWEPILATDWKAPSRSTLARISDRRAKQFWDPQHLVALQIAGIAEQKSAQPGPDCCVKKGFHWDEVALYEPRARWSDGPTPGYWNGPVYRIASALEKAWNGQP
jgi:hypothetical protein